MKKTILGLITLLLLVSTACSEVVSTTTTPSPATTTPVQVTSTSAGSTSSQLQTTIPLEQTTSTTPGAQLNPTSPQDITKSPSTYDGKSIALSGQIFNSSRAPSLLLDGQSGINLTGNVTGLGNGLYNLKGQYNDGTNTFKVTSSQIVAESYSPVATATASGVSLTPVSVQGLIATPPKEIANTLSSYLSIPGLPPNLLIYPYVIYTKDGLYLALSDSLINLPAKFNCLYQGKDYCFTFCAGYAAGTLVKTPLEKLNLGSNWGPREFKGIITADAITSSKPQNATVNDINANPGNYIFQRVTINGDYLLTTATVDYSDIQAQLGQGILADTFSNFFNEDAKTRLETIDPNANTWQFRQVQVTGTVLYPTDQILKYLDYSAPLSPSEIKQNLKPALIVDTLTDNIQQVADISALNPVTGNPSQYWGKVVEFEGYALGINYPLKQVAKAITGSDVPVNVNLLAVGIADNPTLGSQLAIIGLNNDLVGQQGETIKGKYKFRVAVAQVPDQLVNGIPNSNTAFFLLNKQELPMTIPTTLPPVSTTLPPMTTTPPPQTTLPPPKTTTPPPITTTPPPQTTTPPPVPTIPPPQTTTPPPVMTTSPPQTTTPPPQTTTPPATTSLPTLPKLP